MLIHVSIFRHPYGDEASQDVVRQVTHDHALYVLLDGPEGPVEKKFVAALPMDKQSLETAMRTYQSQDNPNQANHAEQQRPISNVAAFQLIFAPATVGICRPQVLFGHSGNHRAYHFRAGKMQSQQSDKGVTPTIRETGNSKSEMSGFFVTADFIKSLANRR